MRIAILGAPGSGKRTQTGLLAEKYGLTVITTSELVKRAMAEESERGMQLRLLHQGGQPLTDDIILNLLQERLQQPDLQTGFALDGFPRNLLQALTLDELLGELGQPLDLVLLIHIETDALMERLVGRRTCRTCGAIYNIYTNPAVVEDVCDLCGGRLHQRAEYNEETVSSRLHVFDHLTSPLLGHYGKLEKLLRVDGDGEVEEVFARVCGAVEDFLEKRKLEAPSEAMPAEQPETQGQVPERAPSDEGGQVTDSVSGAGTGSSGKSPSAKTATGNTHRSAKRRQTEKPAATGQKKPGRAIAAKSAATAPKGGAKKAPAKKPASAVEAKRQSVKKAPQVKRSAAASPNKQTDNASKVATKTKKGMNKVAGKKRGSARPIAKQSAGKPKTPIKKKAVQKKASQKKAVQKKPAQKKPAQKKTVQKKTVHKKPVQKKTAKKQVTQPLGQLKKGTGKGSAGAAKVKKGPVARKKSAPAQTKKRVAAAGKAPAVKAVKKKGAVSSKKRAPAQARKPGVATTGKKAAGKKTQVVKVAKKAVAQKKTAKKKSAKKQIVRPIPSKKKSVRKKAKR